jgi:hypothetical protein
MRLRRGAAPLLAIAIGLAGVGSGCGSKAVDNAVSQGSTELDKAGHQLDKAGGHVDEQVGKAASDAANEVGKGLQGAGKEIRGKK